MHHLRAPTGLVIMLVVLFSAGCTLPVPGSAAVATPAASPRRPPISIAELTRQAEGGSTGSQDQLLVQATPVPPAPATLTPSPAPEVLSPSPVVPPSPPLAVTPSSVPTVTLAASPTYTTTPPPPPTFAPSPTVTPSAAPSPTPSPAQPTTSPNFVRFAVIGDYGLALGAGEGQVAELVMGWQPEFVLTVGDNNYPDGSADTIDLNIGYYYHGFIYPYTGQFGEGADRNRFFPTLGNHDWATQGAQPYLDYFQLPGNERYYEFTWGPVQFFAVDSQPQEPDGVTADSRQGRWLEQGLAQSTSCWQIVYFHAPPYSSGPHEPSEWMRWPFEEWGADAAFSGHDHIYERIVRENIPYFVNGLGGALRYEIYGPVEGSEARYRDQFGAMLVEATRSSISYRFINTAGELIDHFIQDGGCR